MVEKRPSKAESPAKHGARNKPLGNTPAFPQAAKQSVAEVSDPSLFHENLTAEAPAASGLGTLDVSMNLASGPAPTLPNTESTSPVRPENASPDQPESRVTLLLQREDLPPDAAKRGALCRAGSQLRWRPFGHPTLVMRPCADSAQGPWPESSLLAARPHLKRHVALPALWPPAQNRPRARFLRRKAR